MKTPAEALRNLVHGYAAAFRGIPRRVWLLCAVFFVNRAGTMVLPFLSLYAILEQGMTESQAAWILAAFGLGSVVGSMAGGRLTRRLSSLTVQKLSLVLAGGGFLVLTQLKGFEALALGVFAVSLTSDAFRPAAMAAVSEAAPPRLRTRSLALVRLAVNLGQTVGPAAGGLLAALDYRWLFVADGLTCWMAAGLLFLLLPASAGPAPTAAGERAEAAPTPSRSVFRDGPFMALTFVCFLVACVFFQVMGAYPLYLSRECHLQESAIGLLLAFNAFLIVLLEMPLVHFLEGRPLLRVLGFGGILLGLGFGLLPLSCSMAFLLFTVMLWTWGEMVTLPFSNALVAQRAGEGQIGEYMGAYTSMFSVALLVAPPAGLWFYARFGAETLWVSVGLVGPLIWALCRWLEPRFR